LFSGLPDKLVGLIGVVEHLGIVKHLALVRLESGVNDKTKSSD
jgi:hypothetical protein